MKPTRSILAAAFALSAVSGVIGQSYQWSPPNSGTVSGDSNNTIPFWGTSASYQQIHDVETMGSQAVTIKGLGMRPAGTRTITGRSWDLWISMSHTNVNAANASTTFSVNLGSGATSVFGSTTTYKTFSWPTFTTSGTTPAFVVPFDTNFLHVPALGHVCWDWRQRNASIFAFMAMDASSGLGQKGTSLPSVGTGCIATGQTSAAIATVAGVQTNPPAYYHHLEFALSNATANSAAMLALTFNSTTAGIGWCAPVVTPTFLIPGTTDAAGTWRFRAPLQQLAGAPPFNLYAQFGFADTGLPAGIGLTDVGGYTTPNIPGAHGISRIYKSTANGSANGDELATSGSQNLGYGLSVAWLK
ncbi:MAG: hypothetical protein KDC87_00090 [Planctomycetes bacterium]|nr:hypothetical protein [Planctomycetota bacterium]